jgi:crossover junction endodeoxyribonuclease RusA
VIQLFPPSKHRSDLDNYAKSALDLMQDAGVFVNDNQIDHLVIRRRSVLKGGKAIVTIKVIAELERHE